MNPAWMILTPFAGGLAAWGLARVSPAAARWVALIAMAAVAAMGIGAATGLPHTGPAWRIGVDYVGVNYEWLPQIGASIRLECDVFAAYMVILAGVLGVLSVASSWRIERRVGLYHFCLLWMLSAMIGVTLAGDLLLFYVLWEMMLIPLYLLIGIWGGEHRVRAAIKTFIFTQAGSLAMLLGILALYFAHGVDTFSLRYFAQEADSSPLMAWCMLGFVLGLGVKLPIVGLHNWLPDAHANSPDGGGVDIAGLTFKVGAYAMLRLIRPLFPWESGVYAHVGMAIGAASVLYGALMAWGQTNLKRLLAYSSVSHMGFIVLAVFAGGRELTPQGVVGVGATVLIVASGITTGGLFAIAGMIHRRLGTYDLRHMGGLWRLWPRMGGATMVLALATLGLPGLANFVGEAMILFGAFGRNPDATAVAAIGLVLSAIYALRLVQRIFHGSTSVEPAPHGTLARQGDLDVRETIIVALCVVLVVAIGLAPWVQDLAWLVTGRPAR
jgi:NADH-quinone oxidoreductase subunit M